MKTNTLTAAGQASAESLGMWLGFLGVAAFSLTLPATRLAVASLDPVFVGTGRAVVAGSLAAIYLLCNRGPLPTRRQFLELGLVALCVALGFPLLSALAMREVEASHGGVMLGLLPLATAAAGCLIGRERVPRTFWFWAVLGSGLVVAFSLLRGHGQLQAADLALLGALVAAALGYALGARLTPHLGGLQVISWALVLAAPFLVLPAWHFAPARPIPLAAWLSFGYVCVVSQYLGFLPWYRGLALGGVARVGQTQLLQPFLTLLAAGIFLGERLDATVLLFALAVLATVGAGRHAVRTGQGAVSLPADRAGTAGLDRTAPRES